MAQAPFQIAGHTLQPGQRLQIDVPVARLYTHTPLHISIEVVHGRREGPVMLVCGGIHGDEINGVEIVRRLLRSRSINSLSGTLIAVPVVNVFGFLQQTRYLPDRRDLNRCFPGSDKGSLGGRIAALLREEIVDHATHIIDLHTGAIHRTNLPQIRAQLEPDSETARMADAFGAPVVLNAELREGSLRHYAQSRGIPVLTYEAGEALRFDEWAIAPGVRGILRVMRRLKMLSGEQRRRLPAPAELANGSSWARAPIDGILRPKVRLGARVAKGEVLGRVADPFGNDEGDVVSMADGIVIGMSRLPLANEGEALYHIARFDEIEEAETAIESFQSSLEPVTDPMY
ncbi:MULTISPECIES: succinylglutamate desuccinylase/aspartoacylase family protein [unclassified Halomonas]|uniref:succinylglutamate desuccinylase/aspartoacylase family protein n=1 Tax=unclassified Halomonas TaxID=2609666 RepID=UPI0020767351|nr:MULTISPECIES: succinylglutamate desuccinylase/aspartoacylase family protein [unclassified Halomonas]UYG00920.1 succinylglutamate desuccinylase/aspartoacylase family protein [Halomonas sp. GD1P12]WNL38017.1 succinylglutamate desuccinylase/aspartoacylase family protein [Halomonas sp. PAMB 3232]WNL41342.1 succinylglutamate desuccinylase/aspartoacylase family protein [Halomonas sp. PAMB 3264]